MVLRLDKISFLRVQYASYLSGKQINLIGDIAQLGERLNGIQEVRGSNPLISTR